MGYLPSKNFITPVSAALVVILVGWFLVRFWPAGWRTAYPLLTTNHRSQTSFLEAYKNAGLDSDNDGLKDWEEILWKTDPNKADTDGDGALDGQEVKDGRDPTVAGRKLSNGHFSDETKILEKEKVAATSTPQTLTERIAQEFAIQYLTAAGSSVGSSGIDNFQKKAISESLIESVAKGTVALQDQFSPKDIASKTNPSDTFVKAYLAGTNEFLNKTFANLQENELNILNRALIPASPAGGSENFKELDKLTDYIRAYQKTVDFLKKEIVPAPYAALHLELMNILNNTAAADSYMQGTNKDPARGLEGLSIYLNQAERLQKFYQAGGNKLFTKPRS